MRRKDSAVCPKAQTVNVAKYALRCILCQRSREHPAGYKNPCYIKLANTWIILNSGSGPTPDKPEVVLETSSDLNRVNGFLNLRVADI